MKKIICIVISLVLSLSTIAANDNIKSFRTGDLYCAKLKEGTIVVMHQESPITSDIVLDNGTVIKPDGTVLMKDGSKIILKDGECISQDGTLPVK